jgi:hypothetical protein
MNFPEGTRLCYTALGRRWQLANAYGRAGFDFSYQAASFDYDDLFLSGKGKGAR